jgi:peroxiredoxin Q/BCP
MARVAINALAPDFTLADFEGNSFTLSSMRDVSSVMLVFNRGFFCRFCRAHMMALRNDFQKYEAINAKIVVVGPENARSFKKFWAQHVLPFVGLPDPFQNVLKLFGQEVNIFKFGHMPAQAIVDKAGIVRYVHYGNSISDIPENEELLQILQGLD